MDIHFKLPVSVTPQQDSFRIGDTIWIENIFSDQVYNYKSGKSYKVENFDFESTMVISDLNTPEPAKSYPKPKITTYQGKTEGNFIQSSDHQAIYIYYKYDSSTYKYKAAFIPDKPGFYMLQFFSYLDADKVDITACGNETLYMQYETNNAGDNNYEMVKYAKDHEYAALSIEDFNKIGGYCFHVVE
jgi:hypothetical protein